MEKIKLSPTLEVSRFALGFWRLKEWKMSTGELLNFIGKALSLGITTFDHADIYGDYSCEAMFGEALKRKPALRQKMQLVTKCGIKPVSRKFPERKVNHYDTGYQHIVNSVEQSLRNFHTDYLDLLLIHRPDPLMNPRETARAFEDLHRSGKVLHFGVSNFTPFDFDMLQAHLRFPLVTNQVEISPWQLEHFQNGNMAYFLQKGIHPMAWSPLAQGKLLHPNDEKSYRIHKTLIALMQQKEIAGLSTLIYAWLLKHPAGIIPVLGTGKIERVLEALKAFDVSLSTEEWFEIYVAALGHRVP
ncbi:MAG: oxidoreductase [Actinobacteria bacterium]|nr:oxidoreductase [Actinomycetota bacterium]